ncbi:hypothetical protein CCACVL1_30096 [Corchorus capsularis]|uniref:Uncharacterized protein n=1 Tax=Corchorus capsularis TaxID=210143 RepID=A0A1R3FYV9_COCAP|nr:hypothetical protein CCACVL1_30096 [Corchorus capsularis]
MEDSWRLKTPKKLKGGYKREEIVSCQSDSLSSVAAAPAAPTAAACAARLAASFIASRIKIRAAMNA